ncbi:Jag N-terminal domain-containing protein [Elusimicrobiota bacterium]
MNNKIESTGKNIDEAIEKGLKKLGLSKEKTKISILDEGKSGLFGLMGSPAKVSIEPLIGKDKRMSYRKKTISDDELKAAEKYIKIIINFIDDKAEIKFECKDGKVIATVNSEKKPVIIGKAGMTIKSAEYIAGLMLGKQGFKQTSIYIKIKEK